MRKDTRNKTKEYRLHSLFALVYTWRISSSVSLKSLNSVLLTHNGKLPSDMFQHISYLYIAVPSSAVGIPAVGFMVPRGWPVLLKGMKVGVRD